MPYCQIVHRVVTQRQIPNDVLTFLQDRLGGLDELEVLLLVRRDAGRGWTAAEVAEELELPESSSVAALANLCHVSLLRAEGAGTAQRYVYHPPGPDLDQIVSSLAEVYEGSRLEVMRILSRSALERIRSAVARTFSDAFVIGRRGRKRGG